MSNVSPAARFSNLVDVAAFRADELGDKRAYVFLEDGESVVSELSYAELDRRARAMAARLRAAARPGERYILALPPGLDYIVSFWGCLYASVWAVPLYPPLNPKYLARMLAVLRDCDATGVITLSWLADAMKGFLAEQGLAPESLHWVTTDAPDGAAGPGVREAPADPNGVAFLQYTSGSTGEPKGVMVSHRNLMANSAGLYAAYRGVLDAAGGERELLNVSWLPPYHDAGLIDGILQTVYAGKASVLMSPVAFLERPVRWLKAISNYRATASGGPSFGYEYCAKRVTETEAEGLDLSSWVCSVNAAEPVRRDAYDAFVARFSRHGYDARGLTPAYGLAEATLLSVVETRFGRAYWRELDRDALTANVLAKPADPRRASHLVSHGRPIYGEAGVAVVDPETRVERAPDQVGEIWLSGASVALGYWGKPALSEQVFQAYTVSENGGAGRGPFLRTGDYGFLGDDGALFVTGRMKDVIIVRGKNHYPQDLEATASAAHPGLRSGGAAAFAIEAGGAEAFVVVQEARRGLDDAELAQALGAIKRAVVAAHGVEPADVVLVEPGAVPKTSSGKTERFKAREMYRASALPKLKALADLAPAADDGEQKLRRKLERRMLSWIADRADLDVQAIDKRAPFESFGVDSVRVVELVRELEAIAGRKVPDRAVLEHRSIEAMAAFLAAYATGPAAGGGEGEGAPDEGEGAPDEGEGAGGGRPAGFVVPRL